MYCNGTCKYLNTTNHEHNGFCEGDNNGRKTI